MSDYNGKLVLLASMHKKEIAIKPAFSKFVGCNIIVLDDIDTDQFGTFSGEIPREISAYETLKKKAIFAAEIYNYDFVISSEGSFGPHPSYPFINADTEMLLFYDRNLDLFIVDYEISTDTNHGEFILSKDKINSEEYLKWLEQVKFPSHGLIVKADSRILQKGICSLSDLEGVLNQGFKSYRELKLETDMRAMMNPSRMNVINILANKLAKKVATKCIQCGTSGFPKIEQSGNLICELCFRETKIARFKDMKCLKCSYFEREEIKPGEQFTSATYCDYCNP